MTTLDRDFVVAWAGKYERLMPGEESVLFGETGPVVRQRGYYEPEEFRRVANWKTSRTKSRVGLNTDDDIREITRLAFTAPVRFQHRVLALVIGIGIPSATALLTVPFPDRHTILDFRSEASLRRLGEWDGSGGYLKYVTACQRIADRVGVTLRALDRALWRWSRDAYPTGLPG